MSGGPVPMDAAAMRTPAGFSSKSNHISKGFRRVTNLFLTPDKAVEAFELLWVCDESITTEILAACDIDILEIESIGRISDLSLSPYKDNCIHLIDATADDPEVIDLDDVDCILEADAEIEFSVNYNGLLMKIIYHEYTINGFGQVRVYENDGGGYKKWDLLIKLEESEVWLFAYFVANFAEPLGIFLQPTRIDGALLVDSANMVDGKTYIPIPIISGIGNGGTRVCKHAGFSVEQPDIAKIRLFLFYNLDDCILVDNDVVSDGAFTADDWSGEQNSIHPAPVINIDAVHYDSNHKVLDDRFKGDPRFVW